ncbi:hypothetical protein HanRHA438_Chr11g0509211 [Helianthus annuus]|nr:hypothetical protein HanRHA438_Chr11g0509211 [Helianthus annuus]
MFGVAITGVLLDFFRVSVFRFKLFGVRVSLGWVLRFLGLDYSGPGHFTDNDYINAYDLHFLRYSTRVIRGSGS